jgi:hypothetical protein
MRQYSKPVFDCRSRWLPLKVRPLKSEVIEVLLYGCATWTLPMEAWKELVKIHRDLLHRITGHRKSTHDKRCLQSYRELLLQSKCEPIETTIRTRRLMYLGDLIIISRQMDFSFSLPGRRGWRDSVYQLARKFWLARQTFVRFWKTLFLSLKSIHSPTEYSPRG